MARPTKYTEKIATKICSRIAEGESVRAICKDTKMPAASTVFYWLLDKDKKEFLEQYEIARNCQAEYMFEELLEIADTDKDTNKARLKIDTRKWFLSKVLPKKFGDKSTFVTEDEEGKTQPITGIVIQQPNEPKSGDTT